MKKRYFLAAAAAVMTLAACNDDYNDQFDHIKDSSITAAITRAYTLSSADYETIAASETNQTLAEGFAAEDTLPSCSPAELEAIGSNHYFITDTAAQKFIPVLLTSKYSHLGDDGSVVSVTYKKLRYAADYMGLGEKNIGSYELSADDYETVWGDEVKASYLTPKTIKKIATLLKDNISNPNTDSIVVVNYNYDDVEPSIGGGSSDAETQYTAGEWKQVTVPVYPAGDSWSYVNSGDISLDAYAGKHIQVGFCYKSTSTVATTYDVSSLTVNGGGGAVYEYDLTDSDVFSQFTTEGTLPEGLSYVWSYDTRNKCAKASGYANKTNYTTEAYLCSPTMEIKSGYTMNFNHALNYLKGNTVTDFITVYVREMTAVKTRLATRAVSTAATMGYNASAAYTYNGTAWEQLSTDNSTVVVVDPAAYVQSGSTYFTNPKAQIPVYLSNNYPYASKGDIYTVIYKSASSRYSMADYELGDITWSQSKDATKTTTKTLKFQLTDGVWVPNGAYYSNSLLGDDGGFTEKGALPDGLTYVWTNTNSYGWKATAYANKTNYQCTMYLVSSAISLEGADKPALTFDEAYRYINSPETANGLLKVLVTTDYDESNAESYADDIWTELDVPVRASGDDWNFVNVGSIDLSAYKDKTIHIAFSYQSTATSAATWEVKNVEIAEQ